MELDVQLSKDLIPIVYHDYFSTFNVQKVSFLFQFFSDLLLSLIFYCLIVLLSRTAFGEFSIE